MLFPRPQGRGSIEAYKYATLGNCCVEFPRPQGRGSIEAAPSPDRPWPSTRGFHDRKVVAPLKLWTAAVRSMTFRFPRPQGRGSIEAAAPPTRDACTRGCFHDRKVVAPLKPFGRRPARGPAGSFHDRKVVAPLKPQLCPTTLSSSPTFPRPQGRGSIEAMDGGRP